MTIHFILLWACTIWAILAAILAFIFYAKNRAASDRAASRARTAAGRRVGTAHALLPRKPDPILEALKLGDGRIKRVWVEMEVERISQVGVMMVLDDESARDLAGVLKRYRLVESAPEDWENPSPCPAQ